MSTKDREEGGGAGGGVSFYFFGKGEEEELPSESDGESDSSEDELGGGREDGEDADKEKEIKTDWAVFTMTCLNFVLDEINPLGFLYLEVEGWETYTLRGAGVALCGVDDICFVVCEVCGDRDRKRRHITLRDADGFGTPCNDILAAMA